MTEMMKAVRLYEFGGPEVLRYEAAPRPVPGRGEVLVRVEAASLNPPDLYLRDGYRALPPEWRPNPDFPSSLVRISLAWSPKLERAFQNFVEATRCSRWCASRMIS